ncbi:FUN14 family-domain-containing protein [Vararia minispora EC-137]|uniref:FUN14 family-domain-containing protein n=1 Tax=Vararia minispora EC-137 TaxID=1314806 RepID=A0ACB8QVJ0_9AGAM|nr:FUN14 family-domain-containing protein [Vararia minispora EC-137]
MLRRTIRPASGSTATPAPARPPKGATDADLPPPPTSSVNVYELSFGTVCGICAGVFIKKGAKVVAFALGGVFVLLQYLGSKSIIRVDWSRISQKFENLFYSADKVTGQRRPPTILSLWRWTVDFLTADFQPRASFIAGLALGIRLG